MIRACLPSFHKKFGMQHFSDADMQKKVFCLSPLARNSFSPMLLHSPILEKFDEPHFELHPSKQVPIGKNWIIHGKRNPSDLTEQ